MSRSQSFLDARGTLLSAVGPNARVGGIWWTGAVTAVAFQLALPTPAAASPMDVGFENVGPCEVTASTVVSKSEAILGGKMSALEAVQTYQRADSLPACRGANAVSRQLADTVSPELVVATAGTDSDFNSRAEAFAITANPSLLAKALTNLSEKHFRAQSEPFAGIAFAEFMVPQKPKFMAPEQTRPSRTTPSFAGASTSNENILPAPRVASTEPPAKAPFSGKPDIFGTVALRVSHTPLDRKWNGAQNGRQTAIARAALVKAGATVGASHMENNIRAVNRWVNANISYVEDRKLYGQADHWASAGTTLKSGRGDCEDFAIAKMQLLQASGVKASDMFLVIAKDLVRRTDHSLLVIRVGNKMLVLDNETDQILDEEDVRDYRPIMSYSANGKWLHGYPTKPTGTQMASLAVGR
jgi:predicted transglutaminase-like cysteine proteinase